MLEEILKNHKEQINNYYNKEALLRARIERATKQLNKLQKNYKHFSKTFIEPLAKVLQTYFPEYDKFEILGPFGLRNSVSIHFFKRSKSDLIENFGSEIGYQSYFERSNLISITFVSGDIKSGEFFYETGNKDYSCPQNSIGAINGFNNEVKEVTNIDDLLIVLKKQIDSAYI